MIRSELRLLRPFLASSFLHFVLSFTLLWNPNLFPMHDDMRVLYPHFHYFIQNIQNGVFPLWSPYLHCGEPFWPFLQYSGLYNPLVTALAVYAKAFQVQNIGLLFSWFIFLAVVIFNFGTYLCACQVTKGLRRQELILWMIAPIIVLGTVAITAWSQIYGAVFVVIFYPMIALLSIRWVSNREANGWPILEGAILGILCGFQLDCYNPVFFVFPYVIFLLALAFSVGWDSVVRRARRSYVALLAAMILAAMTSLPALVLSRHQSDFVPTGRILSTNSTMGTIQYAEGILPQGKITADIGTPMELKDLVRSLSFSHDAKDGGPDTSEVPLLLGPAGLALLLLGLFAGRVHKRLYSAFMPPFLLTLLIGQGARAKLSLLMYALIPGFRLIRHMEFFGPYVFFNALLVATLGMAVFIDSASSPDGRVSRAMKRIRAMPNALWQTAVALFTAVLLVTLMSDHRVALCREVVRTAFSGAELPRGQILLMLGGLLLPLVIFLSWKFRWKDRVSATGLLLGIIWCYSISNYSRKYDFIMPYVAHHPFTFSLPAPYEGNRYQETRQPFLEPISFPHYPENDQYRGMNIIFEDPLLFYQDTVEASANTQFTAPAAFWRYYQNNQINLDDWFQSLGITAPKLRTTEGQATIHVLSYDVNHILLDVLAQAPAKIFYSQNAMSGWEASVSGAKPQSFSSPSHPFFEIPVPKGRSVISLTYKPWDAILAVAIQYALQVIFVVLSVVYAGVLWL